MELIVIMLFSCCTGTHGTGLTVGNLAENVLSLRIVTGNDGQVYILIHHTHITSSYVVILNVGIDPIS